MKCWRITIDADMGQSRIRKWQNGIWIKRLK